MLRPTQGCGAYKAFGKNATAGITLRWPNTVRKASPGLTLIYMFNRAKTHNKTRETRGGPPCLVEKSHDKTRETRNLI